VDILEKIAKEGSTYWITIDFYDEDQTPFIPATLFWKMTDMAGNVINGRDDIEIETGLAESVTIELSGPDLRNNSDAIAARLVTFWGTYDSINYGNGKIFRQQVKLNIDPEL
jgi:hypothetical protein